MVRGLSLLAILCCLWGAGLVHAARQEAGGQQLAADELTRQLAFLSAANLSPQLSSAHQALIDPGLPPEQRDELLFLGFQLIRAFNQQLRARPLGEDGLGDAPFLLQTAEGGEYPLIKAAHRGEIWQRVAELAPEGVRYLRARDRVDALMRLESIPWPDFPSDSLIEPGQRHPQVIDVRQVLTWLGDHRGPDRGEVYDPGLVDSVRRFQRRHGLAADGVVGPRTQAWLRVTPRVRAQRLARNILRQWHDRMAFDASYLLVNIPDYRLRWITPQGERFSARVVVGRNSRRTPRMATEVVSLVVNPSWNVPRSILRRDLLPKIRRSGDYVSRQGFDAFTLSGEPVHFPPEKWQQVARGPFPYRLSQRPGDGNALGRFKFHLTNSRAIYLHDTAEPELFDRQQRALSSGCVRVEEAELLARQLAFEGEVDEAGFDLARSLGETRWFRLRRPLPVYLVYWSAWLNDKGVAHYRRDIYHQDGDLDHKMAIAMAQGNQDKGD
ncbi:cell wall degradation protein [Ferrimonas sediminicola]|uniref:Cell wall degradation protein n=1 Tax=Ferrimonas sediminicola TaxID=2569538 RepID=A0A4U1BDW6_9GAMM|nr:L,D-transpeptidase family protein [Ferrimonas sediminicola]TKB48978.1 cell wall degradation protein [Ferrimonas sediminicola]